MYDSGVTKIFMDYLGVWKGRAFSVIDPICLSVEADPQDPEGYVGLAREGFSLEPMSKFEGEGVDFTPQTNQYPNGTFHNMTCYKECPLESFFDFGGHFCRRCNRGCSKCRSFTECDVCVPGLHKRVKSIDHPIEDLRRGECLPGCQAGFYLERFGGECKPCANNCSRCVDAIPSNIVGDREVNLTGSFCTLCEHDPEDRSIRLMVDVLTGKCIRTCQEKGMVLEIRAEKDEEEALVETKNRICSRCHDLKCVKCSSPEDGKCLACLTSYTLQKSGRCISIYITNIALAIYFLTFLTLTILFLLAVTSFHALSRKSNHKKVRMKNLKAIVSKTKK